MCCSAQQVVCKVSVATIFHTLSSSSDMSYEYLLLIGLSCLTLTLKRQGTTSWNLVGTLRPPEGL